MTTLYKLTTQEWKTRTGYPNETTWGPNVTHSGTGEGRLCGPGYIHAYTSPLLAVLLNPAHASIPDPVLWEGEGEIVLSDEGLKVGCLTFTTLRIIPLPKITPLQKVAFGILCAKSVCRDVRWNTWADRWLSGENRSGSAARAAAYAAAAGARAAPVSADAAADAGRATALDAAYAAAYAADAARLLGPPTPLDFVGIARRAMGVV